MIGAACIALAAGSTLRTFLIERRREERLLQHMAAALSTIAREIRWKHQPLPAIFTALSEDEFVGKYFAELSEMLDSKTPLQYAWKSVFADFTTEKDLLLAIDVTGDEQQLVTSMERGAQQLLHSLEERKKQRPQQTKLCVAATLSAAGGLILLLL